MELSKYIEIGTGAVQLWPINTEAEINEAEEKMRLAGVQFAPIFSVAMHADELADLIYNGDDPGGRFSNLYMMCPSIINEEDAE
ncbi:MAG: hypothetical protein EBR82_77430 [Caulobacteraceae bacterium]|nr:hypothetical protein [Caulobacteraceae bacterium]NBZ96351.1 hypothetical protein [Pseudomonadota bacterium]